MIAQFTITPADGGHLSEDLARAAGILAESGLEHRIGPLGTCVEGDWDEVTAVSAGATGR